MSRSNPCRFESCGKPLRPESRAQRFSQMIQNVQRIRGVIFISKCRTARKCPGPRLCAKHQPQHVAASDGFGIPIGVTLALLTALLFLCCAAAQAEEKQTGDNHAIAIARIKRSTAVDFDREILPILKSNCLACHNKTTAKAKLILETPQDI